jgi:hypothetical protein
MMSGRPKDSAHQSSRMTPIRRTNSLTPASNQTRLKIRHYSAHHSNHTTPTRRTWSLIHRPVYSSLDSHLTPRSSQTFPVIRRTYPVLRPVNSLAYHSRYMNHLRDICSRLFQRVWDHISLAMTIRLLSSRSKACSSEMNRSRMDSNRLNYIRTYSKEIFTNGIKNNETECAKISWREIHSCYCNRSKFQYTTCLHWTFQIFSKRKIRGSLMAFIRRLRLPSTPPLNSCRRRSRLVPKFSLFTQTRFPTRRIQRLPKASQTSH